MPAVFAQVLVYLVYAYVLVGVLLLPWWHWRGLALLDETAARGPWGFRLLISPGLVALWAFMLARARRAHGHPASEHNAHRDAAAAPVRKEGGA